MNKTPGSKRGSVKKVRHEKVGCTERCSLQNIYRRRVDSVEKSALWCYHLIVMKRERYRIYPRYPAADAGYGSYNNYLYCQEHGMEKFMKFIMYEKET